MNCSIFATNLAKLHISSPLFHQGWEFLAIWILEIGIFDLNSKTLNFFLSEQPLTLWEKLHHFTKTLWYNMSDIRHFTNQSQSKKKGV